MNSVNRRNFILSTTAVAGLAGSAAIWPYRAHILQRLQRSDFKLPSANLPQCDPAPLDSKDARLLIEFFEGLSRSLEMQSLSSEELTGVINLKCLEVPSYRKVYTNFVAALQVSHQSPHDFAADLKQRALAGGVTEAQGLRFVIHEFIALQYLRGGFKDIGFTNVRGYFGGSAGYRKSNRLKGR